MPRPIDSTAATSRPGLLRRLRDAVADVLHEVVRPAGAADVAHGLLHLLGAAALDARLAAGLRRRQAGGDQRLGAALEMILQLAIEIAIERGAAAEASEPGHGRPPSGRRIRPMAAARRSQLAVPLSSCAWPCFVSL